MMMRCSKQVCQVTCLQRRRERQDDLRHEPKRKKILETLRHDDCSTPGRIKINARNARSRDVDARVSCLGNSAGSEKTPAVSRCRLATFMLSETTGRQ